MFNKIKINSYRENDYFLLKFIISHNENDDFYIYAEFNNNELSDKKFLWSKKLLELEIKTNKISDGKIYFFTNNKKIKIDNPKIILKTEKLINEYWIENNLLLESGKQNIIYLNRKLADYQETINIKHGNEIIDVIFNKNEYKSKFILNPTNKEILYFYIDNTLLFYKEYQLFTLKENYHIENIVYDFPFLFPHKEKTWQLKLNNPILDIIKYEHDDKLKLEYDNSILYFNFKGVNNYWKKDYEKLNINLLDNYSNKNIIINFKENSIKNNLKLDFIEKEINNHLKYKIKFITNVNNFWVLFRVNNKEYYHEFNDTNEYWIDLNQKINIIELLDSNLNIEDNNYAYSKIKNNNEWNTKWVSVLDKRIFNNIDIRAINTQDWQYHNSNIIYKGNDISGDLNNLEIFNSNQLINFSPLVKGEKKWISKLIKK